MPQSRFAFFGRVDGPDESINSGNLFRGSSSKKRARLQPRLNKERLRQPSAYSLKRVWHHYRRTLAQVRLRASAFGSHWTPRTTRVAWGTGFEICLADRLHKETCGLLDFPGCALEMLVGVVTPAAIEFTGDWHTQSTASQRARHASTSMILNQAAPSRNLAKLDFIAFSTNVKGYETGPFQPR